MPTPAPAPAAPLCPATASPRGLFRTLAGCLPVVAIALVALGCGPGYLDVDKKVPATDPNKQVFEVVKAYHAAVENKDVEALRKLVSPSYHENGGTTDDPTDDYGYEKCIQRLEMLVKNVKKVQLRVKLLDMQVAADHATVDFQYLGHFVFSEGNVESYRTSDSMTRMTLAREGGRWLITGGL